MARPKKEGMDYFPHDTDAVNDEKLEALRSMYGNDGYAFYFILLERIYRTDSAELDVSKKILIASLASKIGVTIERFIEILNDACELGLFDQDELENNQVITSNGIKKRFSEVNNLRKQWRERKEKGRENVVFSVENPMDNPMENVGKSTQSKGKKSKANIYTSEFEFFWSVYPRNKEKSKAFKCWEARLKEDGVNDDLLIQCAANYAAEVKRKGTTEDYIKLPATFLGPNKPYEDYKNKPTLVTMDKPKEDPNLAKLRMMYGGQNASQSGS